MPLLIPMSLDIIRPPVITTHWACVLFLGDPALARLIGVARPHVPVEILSLGLALATDVAGEGRVVVMVVFAVFGMAGVGGS